MGTTINRVNINWIIISLSFLMVSMILWNTYGFFQKFKEEERIKMENFSEALIELNNTENLNENFSDLPQKIVETNTSTPMILEYSNGVIISRNIILDNKNSNKYLKDLTKTYAKQNKPIEVIYEGKVLSTLYYGDSVLINKLKYYPLALIVIILLFLSLIYFFYKSSKTASQNKLWTAMAKETAHQIGTPLSSLIGWTELLKIEKINPAYINEMNSDIKRLEIITDRFSKIGSIPQLVPMDINHVTKTAISYLKSRSSNFIKFEISSKDTSNKVKLNEELYSWTIENIIKNGIDAMKGKGKINVMIRSNDNDVFVEIKDTGKGIAKSQFKNIFETGYTTKKRGWGLGLSLAKRIIEQYHKGKIRVLESEIGKGTTIQIILKKVLDF